MPQLTLVELQCITTEDSVGVDECRLEVFLDGALQPALKRDMNNGQRWALNQTYTYQTAAQVKLWDEDTPDEDDLLGTVNIGATAGAATGNFTGDGASYKLSYQVAATPAGTASASDAALAAFTSSTTAGVWAHIQKPALIADMRTKLADPFRVNQESAPLCGPAAIVFEMVSRFKDRYVRICRDLYETGAFEGRTKRARPSATLRSSTLHATLTVADWMLQAAMRDVENALFPVDSGSNDFVLGMSTPAEMRGWTFEVLGFTKVDYDSTYFWGEHDAMRKAERARNAGGVAFLLVDSAMVGNPAPRVAMPNHWIVFLGGLTIAANKHVHFEAYSWGQRKTVDLDKEAFEDYMWGVVTGQP